MEEAESLKCKFNDTNNDKSPKGIDQSQEDLVSPKAQSPEPGSPKESSPHSSPPSHFQPPCLNVHPQSRPVIRTIGNSECETLDEPQSQKVSIVEVILNRDNNSPEYETDKVSLVEAKISTENDTRYSEKEEINIIASEEKAVYSTNILMEPSSTNSQKLNLQEYADTTSNSPEVEIVEEFLDRKSGKNDNHNNHFSREEETLLQEPEIETGEIKTNSNQNHCENMNTNMVDEDSIVHQNSNDDNFSDLIFTKHTTPSTSSSQSPHEIRDSFYSRSRDGSVDHSIISQEVSHNSTHLKSVVSSTDPQKTNQSFYVGSISRRSSGSKGESPSNFGATAGERPSNPAALITSPIYHQGPNQQHQSILPKTSPELEFGVQSHYMQDRNYDLRRGPFTTDPSLHSQFLHYSQSNPVTSPTTDTGASSSSFNNTIVQQHTPAIRATAANPIGPHPPVSNYTNQHPQKPSPQDKQAHMYHRIPNQNPTQHSQSQIGQEFMGNRQAPNIIRRLSQQGLSSPVVENPPGHLLPSCAYASTPTRLPHSQDYNTFVISRSQSIPGPPPESTSGTSFAQQQQYHNPTMGTRSHNPPCQSHVPPNKWMSISSPASEESASHITSPLVAHHPPEIAQRRMSSSNSESLPFYPPHPHPNQPGQHVPSSRAFYGSQSSQQQPRPSAPAHPRMPMIMARNNHPISVRSSMPPQRHHMPFEPSNFSYDNQTKSPIVSTHSSLPPSNSNPHPTISNRYNTPGSMDNSSQMPRSNSSDGGYWAVGGSSSSYPAPPRQQIVSNPQYRPASIQGSMQQQQYYASQQQSPGKASGANFVPNNTSSGSYPIVCRVPPIRYRYQGPQDNYVQQPHSSGPGNVPPVRYNSFSGSNSGSFMSSGRGNYNSSMASSRPPYSSSTYPPSSSRPSHPMPHNVGHSGQSSSYKAQFHEGETFHGYSSHISNSSLHDDDMRRFRPVRN